MNHRVAMSVADRVRFHEIGQSDLMRTDDTTFLRTVENGTFPFAQWNHRTHVRVAYLYLFGQSLDAAIALMRAAIQAYNAVHNVPDGPDRGYHETITQAFMRLIHLRMQERRGVSFERFCEANADLLDRRVLQRFYSRGRIMSAEAKYQFVEPDVMPLDSAIVEPGQSVVSYQFVTIRQESASDVAEIRAITAAAFSASHFGHHGEADLIERLRKSCMPFVSLVADVNGRLVGHVLFTPVTLGSGGLVKQGMGLGPVSVLPEFQRQGIGMRLIEAGLLLLANDRHEFVVVLGDPHFYGRFGFASAHQFGVTCEFDGVPADAFQIRWLDHSGAHHPTGIVKYHAAFAAIAQPDHGGS